MASVIRLDSGGIAQVLKSAPVAGEIARLAAAVRASVQSAPSVQRHGMTSDITPGVTDRARANVTITHPGGLSVQAKYGVLTRAAASAGLEVNAK